MDQWDEVFGEVVSSYSRAQAIEDGVLVDVSSVAREAGIKFPVAVTRGVWTLAVEVPKGVRLQDEAGRLWDVLSMLRFAIKTQGAGSDIFYTVLVRNDNRRPRPVRLHAICGPGDTAEPVITVMLPDED